MKVLVLWGGPDGRAKGIAQRIGAYPDVTVEQIQPKRSLGGFDRFWHWLIGRNIVLQPLQHDPRSFGVVALCCEVPGNRMPLEIKSFINQRHTDLPQIALVLISDHFVTDTSPVIEQFERLSRQRPIALLELPAGELNPDGTGITSRPWLSQCRIESFLGKLDIAIPDHRPSLKEDN